MRHRFGAALVGSGGIAILFALLWWALVFSPVVSARVLSLREATLCLVDSSGLCQAVVTMCTQSHPLGLKTYSPGVLLLGLTLLALGLASHAVEAWLAPRCSKYEAPRAIEGELRVAAGQVDEPTPR